MSMRARDYYPKP